MQAGTVLGFKVLSDNQLGTAATNIHHQAAAGAVRQGVGNTQINQAGFFLTGNDVNVMAQNGFCLLNKGTAIEGYAQCTGGDHAHAAGRQVANTLGETTQTVESALHGVFVQKQLVVQPCSQLNLLAHAIEDTDILLVGFCHNHVEAVGTQVDGGYLGEVFLLGHGLIPGSIQAHIATDNVVLIMTSRNGLELHY